MLGYRARVTEAVSDAPERVRAIVSSSTPEGLVEQSLRLCERFDCKESGLYRAIEIAKEYASDAIPAEPIKDPEPVGTELAKLIPDWAVQFKGGCGCKDMQKKMDRWGVVGCRARTNEIVAHLLSQSDRLIPAFKIVPRHLKRIAAIRMLNKAIKNSEA